MIVRGLVNEWLCLVMGVVYEQVCVVYQISVFERSVPVYQVLGDCDRGAGGSVFRMDAEFPDELGRELRGYQTRYARRRTV